ncbi:hypothetical protein QP185_21110 [Sphingomonas aerolata]|uniref:hypothetical protein n=1 Tax=Sphingomonas aerolata TaxID=185951 RepID=UPI002FE340C2
MAPNLREFALRNQSSPLGCSPWEACTTDHDLDSAIRVVVIQAGAGDGDGDGDEKPPCRSREERCDCADAQGMAMRLGR